MTPREEHMRKTAAVLAARRRQGMTPRAAAGAPVATMNVRIMHMLHDLEVENEAVGTTVRLGCKWAESAGLGLFLCTCSAPCMWGEECGKTLSEDSERTDGHDVVVVLPWNEEGEPATRTVRCCDNCTIQGTGAVIDTWVGRFHDVPARLLQYEHEKRSREYLGLLESMTKAYGEEFGEGSYVSLVLYRRTT